MPRAPLEEVDPPDQEVEPLLCRQRGSAQQAGNKEQSTHTLHG